MKTLAIEGIKPGAFWLQDAFSNLLATFIDSILAPRWRGSYFRRPWQRRARRCDWTSGTYLSRWTRPVTAPSSSSPSPSTTSLMTTAPSEPGLRKVDHGSNVKFHWQIRNLLFKGYESQTSNKLILLVSCLFPNPDILFISAVDLCCCPETIRNTSVSNTIALGDMFLLNDQDKGPGRLSSISPLDFALHWRFLKEFQYKATVQFVYSFKRCNI